MEIDWNSSILSKEERITFLELLKKNNKHIGKEWSLIYRKSRDGRLNDEMFIKQKYENKQNILCLIESEDNNVLGGYSYSGWKSGHRVYNRDEAAYVFNIRSSKGYDPIICNAKHAQADKAIFSYNRFYLIFGGNGVINVDTDGIVYHNNPSIYSSLPTSKHLMGGSSSQKVKDMEIFEIK